MKDYTEALESLCGIIGHQIEKITDYLEKDADGKIDAQDAEYLDHLTHAMKSVKTTIAMGEYGASERRGRDRMGRYTSRLGEVEDMDESKRKLRAMMESTPDERVRRALESAYRNM